MTRSPRLAALLLLAAPAVLGAPPARAQDIPPLGRVEPITEGLIATAIAYEIGERCDTLQGRRIQGIAYLWSLAAHAQSLGFSRAEIEDYIDNEAEKDRIEALARERFAAMGGVEGQWDTYCAVGRAEMAKGSQIGRLLAEE